MSTKTTERDGAYETALVIGENRSEVLADLDALAARAVLSQPLEDLDQGRSTVHRSSAAFLDSLTSR